MFDRQITGMKTPGEHILENVFQIDLELSKWVDLRVLFSMIVVYQIMPFVMIKINEDVTPWVWGYTSHGGGYSRRTGASSRLSHPMPVCSDAFL